MSLLKHIYIAKNDERNKRVGGWADFDTWNLATTNFETREDAEHAYEKTVDIYNNIVENQTWSGLQSQGKSPTATEVSFRHHIWIDENDDGFTLCVSFDKSTQTRDFMTRTKSVLGEMKFESFTILQGVSDQINRYMTATHSVEVDIVGVDTANKFMRSFEQAAQQTALYTDRVRKATIGADRCKAYFNDETKAQEFASRIKNVVYTLRAFPSAKDEQPKRFQVA